MKKLFILTVFLIGIANHIPAQVSLADLLEGKLVAKESTMAAVSEAVRPALGIIRQQYRLKRDGEYYGKNRMPYYGESYTVSVKVAGGLIFTKEVVSFVLTFILIDNLLYFKVPDTVKVIFSKYVKNVFSYSPIVASTYILVKVPFRSS